MKLTTRGKIRLAISFITYLPVALYWWAKVPAHYNVTSRWSGKTTTKASLLRDVLGFNYRVKHLKDIVLG